MKQSTHTPTSNDNIVIDSLFELIDSMSPTEKRYFIIRIEGETRKVENYPDYYTLFQILNKKKEYDEKEVMQELLEAVGKKSFSNFTVKKNELYASLMKHLKNYHLKSSKKSADNIKIFIQDADFLFKRGLYRQAYKKLKLGRRIAVKCGDTLSLIEMNRLEREFLRTNQVVKMDKRMDELHQEEEKLIEDLKVEANLIKEYDRLGIKLLKKSRVTDAKSGAELKSEFGHLKELKDKKDLPNLAQRFLSSSLVNYYYLLGENDKAQRSMEAVLEWWNENELWKRKMPHYYIIALSNLLSGYNRTKEYNNFLNILNLLEKVEVNTDHEKTLKFLKLINHRQIYYLNIGLLEEACNMGNRIEKGLRTYKLNERHQVSIIYNTIIAHFINNNYSESLRWIAFYKPFKKMERGLHLVQIGQILKVIVYYELGEFDKMEYAYRSALRYFSSHLKLPKSCFEQRILELVYKFHNALPSVQIEIHRKIKEYIEIASEEYKQVGMDEIMLWTNSKLKECNMKSLLLDQKKASK